ncbi:hypothetical protein E1B28_010839 [Marasmius oreades]|uniref:Uncharacterized protein n=1 Tax=Marasmius oreades TaxID=181124 RepID=A0A9P7UQK8_9AGAR|nr:uncharacterized protein E1B28_010839 [Marasmius oreades]KAG7089131.1 hypothetical protein E1B28_010839 [Marasmius oreades]
MSTHRGYLELKSPEAPLSFPRPVASSPQNSSSIDSRLFNTLRSIMHESCEPWYAFRASFILAICVEHLLHCLVNLERKVRTNVAVIPSATQQIHPSLVAA